MIVGLAVFALRSRGEAKHLEMAMKTARRAPSRWRASTFLGLVLAALGTAAAACGDDTELASPPSSAGDAGDPGTDASVPDRIDPGHDGAADAMPDAAPDAPVPGVHLQILALSDLQGQLEPAAGNSGMVRLPDGSNVQAGGVAFLASHVRALRAKNPNTVFVSAGNLVGFGLPMIQVLHDEPTIEAMNLLGLDYAAIGTGELHGGLTELLRLRYGGCHPVDGCRDGTGFAGASFPFLASNILTGTGPGALPRYAIREVGGVKVAFVGVSLERTPEWVPPSAIAGLTFEPEVASVNALVPELHALGARTIVVLLHEGGASTGSFDGCDGLSGRIAQLVPQLSDAIDVVIGARNGSGYNCTIGSKLVAGVVSFGRMLTAVDLEIDGATGTVSKKTAKNIVVTRETPAADLEELVSSRQAAAAPYVAAEIGEITGDMSTVLESNGLSTMGLVVADAQLAATSSPAAGGARIAFADTSGVRASLPFAPDGKVTYGEAFTVQPFGRRLVVLTLTGAQIHAALEEQFQALAVRRLQPSKGFSYSYSASAPNGSKIDPASMRLDGTPIDLGATYRVTVDGFLAAGGNGFTTFPNGTERTGGVSDLEALVSYFATESPIAPPATDRVVVLP